MMKTMFDQMLELKGLVSTIEELLTKGDERLIQNAKEIMFRKLEEAPNDIRIAHMTRVEQNHNPVHQLMWKDERYINMFMNLVRHSMIFD